MGGGHDFISTELYLYADVRCKGRVSSIHPSMHQQIITSVLQCKSSTTPPTKKRNIIQAIIDSDMGGTMQASKPSVYTQPTIGASASSHQLVSVENEEGRKLTRQKMMKKLVKKWTKSAAKNVKYLERVKVSRRMKLVFNSVIEEAKEMRDGCPWTIRQILDETSVRLDMDLTRGQPLCFVHKLLRNQLKVDMRIAKKKSHRPRGPPTICTQGDPIKEHEEAVEKHLQDMMCREV